MGSVASTRAVSVILLAILVIGGGGCDSRRKRAVGFFTLGNAREFVQEREHHFGDKRILLRYDEGGFSAMSTECPYDGASLQRSREGDKVVWRSPTSASAYDASGRVIHGPSTYNLPFYELRLDRDSYNGATPTLFVHVGVERDADWRLTLGATKSASGEPAISR